MLCEPVVREEVEKDAVPELRVPVPIALAPSLKVTLPAGVPLPDCGATVAVKVTFWPPASSVFEAVREVVVPAGGATCGVNTRTVAEYAGKL